MPRIFFFLCIIALVKGNTPDSLKLQQVLILGRHNIRTPLTADFVSFSPLPWPKFNESVADLTAKGALLESYMAEYIAKCLARDNLIKGCPNKDEVLIYSNSRARTRDTAIAFVNGAFPSCNLTVYHQDDVDISDPVFHPVIHNETEYFKQQVIEEMEKKLNDSDLTEAYLELNRILDLKESEACKKNCLCDLSEIKTEVVYEVGEEPAVSGRVKIGTSIVDAFIMIYYEGFSIEEVAWGKITTQEQWQLLSKAIKLDQNVRFATSGSKDYAGPLLDYMFDIFRRGNPKLAVLVGHDSNINSVLSALDFKYFVLENQFEPFPIGGKVMFQKWSDGNNSFLKVEYLYQTSLQLRNGDKSSMAQPPEKVLLELKDCKIDELGFCPWNDFVNLRN